MGRLDQLGDLEDEDPTAANAYVALAQPPPRRAAAADEAAPFGGRPALFRLVARLRVLRQPDAADVSPAGRPDAGATVSIFGEGLAAALGDASAARCRLGG